MRSLAALFSMLLLASTGQAETTGNLLENPGAETGTTEPWGTSDGVQEGPLTIGEATLDATEGTHWFVADEHVGITQVTQGTGYLIHYLTQAVDLRGLGTIESVTMRGDLLPGPRRDRARHFARSSGGAGLARRGETRRAPRVASSWPGWARSASGTEAPLASAAHLLTLYASSSRRRA
jgi:hypothetical protein